MDIANPDWDPEVLFNNYLRYIEDGYDKKYDKKPKIFIPSVAQWIQGPDIEFDQDNYTIAYGEAKELIDIWLVFGYIEKTQYAEWFAIT